MMTAGLVLVSALLLAFANGANDNIKGVATLLGSGASGYRRALGWASLTTFAGSLAAILFAQQLLKNFTGRGLVADSLVADANFMTAVALGAGLTVLLATRLGMPISTTHSLVGALVGAGLSAGSSVNVAQLGAAFFLPLLASPFVALAATGVFYPPMRWIRQRLGITAQTCLCVGSEVVDTIPTYDHAVAVQRAEQLTLRLGNRVTCQHRYAGKLLGIDAAAALDWSHFATAGAVSFARGLNDTPKIAALLLAAPQLGGPAGIALVGLAIAVGGWTRSARVAETMSRRITGMNHGQGFAANLMTSAIVIGASGAGMPVSTTHVSCGALFGIGALTGQARWRTIGQILAAWVTTLPLGVLLGAVGYWVVVRSF